MSLWLSFAHAAKEALPTLSLAWSGFAWALLAALLFLLVRGAQRSAERYLVPVLLALYTLPPFVTVIAGRASGLTASLPLLQVVGALALPLAIQLGEAVNRAAVYTEGYRQGTAARRSADLVTPLVAVELMSIAATLMPWALLAALLAEIANGSPDGIGVKLMLRLEYGFSSAWPSVVVVALGALVPYFLLHWLGAYARGRLGLTRGRIDRAKAAQHDRLSPVFEAAYLLGLFVLLWLYLHVKAPLIAPSPFSRSIGLRGELGSVLLPLLATAVSAIFACLLGCVGGLVLTLLARMSAIVRVVAAALLLPLQLLPLIIFVPVLIGLQTGLESELWHQTSRIPPGLRGTLPAVMVALFVAGLAAAYASYEIGRRQLAMMPHNESSLLQCLKLTDLRVARHVHLPWLLRTLPATLEIAMPRVLLAVLVTEHLATRGGMGGELAELKGASMFAQAWFAVMSLFALFVLLNLLCRFITRLDGQLGGTDG
jgi:ABC-type nitrate/sulfonate/bicarbonate transport system permease component